MSRGFRLLAGVTAVSAYLQIALGGVVRNSGSGLGCQDQWPLCNGRPYPGWEIHAMVEYSHRTFGALASALMLATFLVALARYRRRRPLLAWTSGMALVVVALEIPLGALVVFRDLAGLLVLAHLAVAMAILGLVLATAVLGGESSREPGHPGRGLQALTGAVAALAFFTLLTGGLVVAGEADEQCHAWPLCGTGLQFDFSGVNALTMVHRLTVLGLVLLATYAAWRAWRAKERRIARWSLATLVVILVQASIGAGAALLGESVLFNSLHVAIAAAVWGTASVAALVSLAPPGANQPATGAERSSSSSRTGAAVRSSGL